MTQRAKTLPDRGSALFNNRHLVTVVEGIAERRGSEFSTRQLAQSCGLADSLVRSVLRRLISADMIREHTRRGGVRGELLYQVRDPKGWRLLVSLCRELAQQ